MAVAIPKLLPFSPQLSTHGIPNRDFPLQRHHPKSRFGSKPRNSFVGFSFKPLPKASASSVAAAAASSTPAIGSPAEYPGQWLEEKKEQKRRRIAGVEQEELLDPTHLADEDSCFCEFKGILIHHKVCDVGSQTQTSLHNQVAAQLPNQAKKPGLPMILLHGFGASVYSWDRVMKPLAQITGSKVLAFDRPAFGLTSRKDFLGRSSPSSNDARPLNPYSMAFAILATLYFIDTLGAEKAILVGHSAGSLVAINSYFEAPERVAALILVAPAVLAPLFKPNIEGNQLRIHNNVQQSGSNSSMSWGLILQPLSNFVTYISQAIMRLVKGMGNMLSSLSRKVLSMILRSSIGLAVVRLVIDKFGVAAIKSAWYDASQVTDHVLHGYTKPLRTKGWDRALVDFTAAILTDSAHESKSTLAERLNEISCPVLLITGDTDRLVPRWNTERLSQAIPGSILEVIKNCGHLPQEERSEDFMEVIQNFLQRVFGAADRQPLQAAV